MAAIAEVAQPQIVNTRRRERIFYTGMSIAILLTVFAGFSRTFYLRPLFNPPPLIPLLILHGVIFTSWIILLVTQTTLVAANKTRVHRKLGVAGLVIAISMLLVGTFTALVRARGIQLPP